MAQAHTHTHRFTEFALSHDVGGEDEETVAAAASGDAAAGGMSSKVCQAGGAARRRTHVKQGVSSWRSCASAARAFAHSRQLWMRVAASFGDYHNIAQWPKHTQNSP